jgi:hypothetical protein
MTAAATSIQVRNDQFVGQPIDTIAAPSASTGLRGALTAFIDTVLDNLAAIVTGPDEAIATQSRSSAPSRAAIVGNPDPRITRSLRTPAHHD